MHSSVIAINAHPTEETVLEQLPKGADYVIDRTTNPRWLCGAYEQMRLIGAVNESGGVKPIHENVKMALESMYDRWVKSAFGSFDDFTDDYKVFRAKAALDDNYGLYVYYGDWDECVPWAHFLRWLYHKDVEGALRIEAVYDYHF